MFDGMLSAATTVSSVLRQVMDCLRAEASIEEKITAENYILERKFIGFSAYESGRSMSMKVSGKPVWCRAAISLILSHPNELRKFLVSNQPLREKDDGGQSTAASSCLVNINVTATSLRAPEDSLPFWQRLVDAMRSECTCVFRFTGDNYEAKRTGWGMSTSLKGESATVTIRGKPNWCHFALHAIVTNPVSLSDVFAQDNQLHYTPSRVIGSIEAPRRQ